MTHQIVCNDTFSSSFLCSCIFLCFVFFWLKLKYLQFSFPMHIDLMPSLGKSKTWDFEQEFLMQIRESPIILTDKKWYDDKIHLTDKSRVTMILGDINHPPQVVIIPKTCNWNRGHFESSKGDETLQITSDGGWTLQPRRNRCVPRWQRGQVLSTAFEKSEAPSSNGHDSNGAEFFPSFFLEFSLPKFFHPNLGPPTTKRQLGQFFFWQTCWLNTFERGPEVVMGLSWWLGGFVGVGKRRSVERPVGSVSRAEDDGAEAVCGGHHWESRRQYQGTWGKSFACKKGEFESSLP